MKYESYICYFYHENNLSRFSILSNNFKRKELSAKMVLSLYLISLLQLIKLLMTIIILMVNESTDYFS